MNLKGKTAVITGMSRGIGKGIALRLAKEGVRLAGMSLRADALKQTEKEITAAGGEAVTLAGSVARLDDIERLMARALERFGGIDMLINNAGIVHPPEHLRNDVLDITESDWHAVVDTNLKGAFFCSQAAARHMIKGVGGRIINIASVLSYRVNPPAGVLYHVSKGGMIQLTAILAALLSPRGVIVTGIAPGWIETDLTRGDLATDRERILSHMIAKRIAMPADVAELVLFLLSEQSQYLSGQTIVFDGGQSVLGASS